jgi:predicted small metal-binding protein
MTRELRCRDAGFDCDAVVRAESDDEVMAQATEHVRDVHGMTEIDDTTANHIRSQIQDAA